MTTPFFRPYRGRRGEEEKEPGLNQPATHLIAGSVEDYLKSQGIASVSTVAKINDCWSRIVGDQAAAHAIPSKIVDDELVILVDHPAWATELRLQSARILLQLENELKGRSVKRLKVHVRS